jgi:hypothetical protein
MPFRRSAARAYARLHRSNAQPASLLLRSSWNPRRPRAQVTRAGGSRRVDGASHPERRGILPMTYGRATHTRGQAHQLNWIPAAKVESHSLKPVSGMLLKL